MDKGVKLISGGSVINGPTSSSLITIKKTLKCFQYRPYLVPTLKKKTETNILFWGEIQNSQITFYPANIPDTYNPQFHTICFWLTKHLHLSWAHQICKQRKIFKSGFYITPLLTPLLDANRLPLGAKLISKYHAMFMQPPNPSRAFPNQTSCATTQYCNG